MNAFINGAMIAAPSRCAVAVLLLLKTYVDIIALRRGPDALPRSWLVVGAALVLLAAACGVQLALIENLTPRRMAVALLGYAFALGFYGTVLYVFGFFGRLTQALSSIIGCGSILAVSSLAALLLLEPLVGDGVALVVGQLIWFWSIPVKGHIVARAIDQRWFVGITIAVSAFVMRVGVETSFAA